ncbi:beta-1,4 N-acetylgalactosaminyltransferase 1a [Cololabis saira]|uniref:beta-1,4 N-acetylgalactosaminyltransferase 1a n=1 Tax=Cololabis saira TaxID=129043 RepID=UPI002AD2000F|nr:beta-1,4 N-acetylgalactosaminyltransferase 1a [Cololabis saira]XP_061592145.1 beta-1,4 N-acetylgalactosaminyltransferase 1a [Cololabis saira]XP_061592146.1 beta-1,4 N-acetylgalactosaminyltransferase 1a [Cololabis saira]XP_061592147.1 beta-1,4 N-acetylgalactosaminyltransferase 1a [Cololabis saira]
MGSIYKKSLKLFMVAGLLLVFYFWRPWSCSGVDIQPRRADPIQTLLDGKTGKILGAYPDIPYHIKEEVASRLAQNTCVCLADEETFHVPFSDLLFPRVGANNLAHAFLQNNPHSEKIKNHRAQEYNSFQRRSYSPADVLIVAEANSPLQYPTQGVKVQPLRTIIIPGLGLKQKKRSEYMVYLNATLGTFDVAATVDKVSIKGLREKKMTLSSPQLTALNRQLQFVTYTSTVFHPRTADSIQFGTEGYKSFFTIKVEQKKIPKLYNSGYSDEYNITALVTIATKTFLRYNKLEDLIKSIRQYYPNVTIVIADDNEHPQRVTGPRIEHYIMPYGKGWFAGRNLAVSQVATKYVLWVDDDFIFTSNTKLEKMVDILERTTLDLVGGAVREVTGYTATYRHTLSVEEGGEDGDCLHIRRGYHHVIEGFPNCVVADGVINFFMARTHKMLEVGFDPRLSRSGHLEFFVDALGSLHIGSCDDVIINHASKIHLPWSKTGTEKAYDKFRYSKSNGGMKLVEEIFYFKNRFKCTTSPR